MHFLTAGTLTIAMAASFAITPRTLAHRPPQPSGDVELLSPLVGEWQSDTVMSVSARSSCAWTPRHGGVMCEQLVVSPSGTSTALSLFTADSATGEFVFYVMSRRGAVISPIPVSIHGPVWVYGGRKADDDGRFYRTVNDFSRTDAYDWRQETSRDGKDWSVGVHGQSRRVQ